MHYPLPLLEEEADVGVLKATIRKLREELGEARQAAGSISKVKHQNGLSAVERENKTLRKEKEILTERLQTLENNMGVSTADIKQVFRAKRPSLPLLLENDSTWTYLL